jgi:uncharacterized protein (TIGR02996 family)
MSAPSHPELEAAILRDPDDVDAHLVYGDWLQGQGHPQGELIQLMHELERASESQADLLREQILSLFRRSLKVLLGKELAQRVSTDGVRWEEMYEGGPLELLVHAAWQGPKFNMQCWMHWRLGFIHKAVMASESRPSEPPHVEPGLPALIGKLLSHASARFLRRLEIALLRVDEPEYVNAIQALVKTGCPRTLETLSLVVTGIPSDGHGLDMGAVSLEPLYSRLPRLKTLILKGSQLVLGKLRLPELRDFTITHDRDEHALPRPLMRPLVESIAHAELPQLESLTVSLGWNPKPPKASLTDLLPLLDGRGMPRLQKLGLQGLGFTDALCKELPGSTLLPQLRELDLTYGTMTAAGAETLLASASAFRHLERLQLDARPLDRELRMRLEGLCTDVFFEWW